MKVLNIGLEDINRAVIMWTWHSVMKNRLPEMTQPGQVLGYFTLKIKSILKEFTFERQTLQKLTSLGCHKV